MGRLQDRPTESGALPSAFCEVKLFKSWRLLVVLVLFVVLSASGVMLWQQYARGSSRRHVQDGLRAAQSADVGRAVREFEMAAELDGENADALYNLGLAYVDAGRNHDAVDAYLRALRVRPNSAAIHLNLGNAYNRLGDKVRAIQEWKTALQLDERAVPARINLAIAAAMDGQTDLALRYFREAAELEPDNARVRYNLGSLYIQLGQLEKAEAELGRARQLNPDLPYLLFNLAKVYELRGEFALAISAYRQALREHPNEAISHCRLGQLLLKSGNQREEALRELETCQKEVPEAAKAKGITGFIPGTATKARKPLRE